MIAIGSRLPLDGHLSRVGIRNSNDFVVSGGMCVDFAKLWFG